MPVRICRKRRIASPRGPPLREHAPTDFAFEATALEIGFPVTSLRLRGRHSSELLPPAVVIVVEVDVADVAVQLGLLDEAPLADLARPRPERLVHVPDVLPQVQDRVEPLLAQVTADLFPILVDPADVIVQLRLRREVLPTERAPEVPDLVVHDLLVIGGAGLGGERAVADGAGEADLAHGGVGALHVGVQLSPATELSLAYVALKVSLSLVSVRDVNLQRRPAHILLVTNAAFEVPSLLVKACNVRPQTRLGCKALLAHLAVEVPLLGVHRADVSLEGRLVRVPFRHASPPPPPHGHGRSSRGWQGWTWWRSLASRCRTLH
ncbi:unnamed protein product [Sphagnum tenellum]